MAQVVVMPQLGNTVESCLITTWLVAVGDTVDAATLLCEIETDKSAMEVPAGVAGTVLALLAQEGDDVPVKQPIAVVGRPDENVEAVSYTHLDVYKRQVLYRCTCRSGRLAGVPWAAGRPDGRVRRVRLPAADRR